MNINTPIEVFSLVASVLVFGFTCLTIGLIIGNEKAKKYCNDNHISKDDIMMKITHLRILPFNYWSHEAIAGYKTALTTIYEYVKKQEAN